MLDLKTGKEMTRRDALKGGLAAILAAGVAPSLCGSITRGMMYRNLGVRIAMVSQQKEDNRWAQEVMWKVYPTTEFIEEHHNQRYTEELTKVYGEN